MIPVVQIDPPPDVRERHLTVHREDVEARLINPKVIENGVVVPASLLINVESLWEHRARMTRWPRYTPLDDAEERALFPEAFRVADESDKEVMPNTEHPDNGKEVLGRRNTKSLRSMKADTDAGGALLQGASEASVAHTRAAAGATPAPATKQPMGVVLGSPTGEFCGICGSANMVRAGTCSTCQDCGSTSGCA